ncbi:hypothetical protein [Scytonema sp. NUACC21]
MTLTKSPPITRVRLASMMEEASVHVNASETLTNERHLLQLWKPEQRSGSQ